MRDLAEAPPTLPAGDGPRDIALDACLRDAYRAIGFARMEVVWKADKMERFLTTRVEAEAFRAEVARFGAAVTELGVDVGAIALKLDTGELLGFEPPRYGNEPPTLTVSPVGTHGSNPSFDPSAEQLYGRACLAHGLVERILAGIRDTRCASVAVTVPLRLDHGMACAWAEGRALAEALGLQFQRTMQEPEGTRVTLHFQNWWTLEFTRMEKAGTPGCPVRIQTFLGEPGVPIGPRLADLSRRAGALDAIRRAVDTGVWLEFKLNAWRSKILAADPTWLDALEPVARDVGASLRVVKPDFGVPRHHVVGLSHEFVVETALRGVANKVSVYLPWFHPSRLAGLRDVESFVAAARGDLARAERVRAWMAETGRVEMFWVEEVHAPWCMDDARLDELLAALTPHVAAIDRGEDEPFGRVFLFLQGPQGRVMVDRNYIRIPMPELQSGDLAPFLTRWFAEHPLPEVP